MAAYMILQITVSDRLRMRQYAETVVPLIGKFGGRQIVRSAKVELLEGTHDGRALSIFEFPSVDAIHAFWTSPEYVPVKEMRRGAASLDIWVVDGL